MSVVTGTGVAERSQVYALLATVFRRPLDRQQLDWLRAPTMLDAMAAAGVDPGTDFIRLDAETLLDRLAVDYTQLFHAPADRIVPYEGVQTMQDDRLMGSAAHSVQDFMAEVGFAVAAESGEYPDHISVELTFMSELARREADAVDAGNHSTAERAISLQRRFLAEHLGVWAGRLAGKIRDGAPTDFHRSMAVLLDDFIAAEQADLVLARDG